MLQNSKWFGLVMFLIKIYVVSFLFFLKDFLKFFKFGCMFLKLVEKNLSICMLEKLIKL